MKLSPRPGLHEDSRPLWKLSTFWKDPHRFFLITITENPKLGYKDEKDSCPSS
jgi:hypothetical protein